MKALLRRLAPLPFALALTSAFAADPLEDPINSPLPVVLTPARLRQSLSDVPAAVTVLTEDMLKAFGIRSVPEALQLVPGMEVAQVTGNDFRINYHGTNILTPRRMNVQVDGMSVYRPAFARVDWDELPVAFDDIARIEITRGPDSASYGANSMLAIVNIITKQPRDADGVAATVSAGTPRGGNAFVRYSGKLGESTDVRVSAERFIDTGYDYANSTGAGHDSTYLSRLNVMAVSNLSAADSVTLQAYATQGTRQSEFAERYQQSFPNMAISDAYLNFRWNRQINERHQLQLQAYTTHHRVGQAWRSCLPSFMLLPELGALWQANPAYVNTLLANKIPAPATPADATLVANAIKAYMALGTRARQPTCGNTNQDFSEIRDDLELQDTVVLSDALRVVSGFGFRQDAGDSDTYLAGRQTNQSWRAFANAEYKPSTMFTINAGGYFEHSRLTGSAFSPRVAVNVYATRNHVFRFVTSRADRMPNIQEMRVDWRYHVTDLTPPLNGATDAFFFQSARSSASLAPERIRSHEIGYLGNLPELGLVIDAKLFRDNLSDLISEKLQLASFTPTNRNEATLQGAELQLNYQPNSDWLVHAGYTYLDNNASTPLEQTQYSRHSGMVALAHQFRDRWHASLALYRSPGMPGAQSDFGRQDLAVSHDFSIARNAGASLMFKASHLSNRTSSYFVDVGQRRDSVTDQAMRYSLILSLSY